MEQGLVAPGSITASFFALKTLDVSPDKCITFRIFFLILFIYLFFTSLF